MQMYLQELPRAVATLTQVARRELSGDITATLLTSPRALLLKFLLRRERAPAKIRMHPLPAQSSPH